MVEREMIFPLKRANLLKWLKMTKLTLKNEVLPDLKGLMDEKLRY